jgi:predicted transcriptional regulator
MKQIYIKVPEALLYSDTLSDRAKIVFIMITREAPYANDNKLAKMLKMSKVTYQKYVRELIAAGWLERKTIRLNGQVMTVEYNIYAYDKEDR